MSAPRLNELFSSNSFLSVNKNMICGLGLEMAVFLSDLVDRHNYFLAHSKNFKGWFFALKRTRSEVLGMSERKLERLMSKAVGEGYVETKMVGRPAKQWMCINFEAVAMDVSLPKTGQTSLPKFGEASKENETKEEFKIILSDPTTPTMKRTIHPKPTPVATPTSERTKNFIPLAKLLSNAIWNQKKIKPSSKAISNWSWDIRLLCEQSGVNPDRVKRALTWYIDNIGKEYVPEIYSGAALRNKFIKLECAIDREKNDRRIARPKQTTASSLVLTEERRKMYEDMETIVIEN